VLSSEDAPVCRGQGIYDEMPCGNVRTSAAQRKEVGRGECKRFSRRILQLLFETGWKGSLLQSASVGDSEGDDEQKSRSTKDT
jgi:hypothetical protein